MEQLVVIGDMPWQEDAVAALQPPSSSDRLPRIISSGTLTSVTAELLLWDVAALRDVRVTLPNRARSPYSFHGPALLQLLDRARERAAAG